MENTVETVAVPNSMCVQEAETIVILEAEAAAAGKKLAVQVVADSSGEFCGNGIRYTTADAAIEAGNSLSWRWTAVKRWRVVIAD